jgi:hypothetical protein
MAIFPYGELDALPPGLTRVYLPVFQSYSSYTRRLTQLNSDFLSGARAPDWLVFRVWPIDKHYAAMEDPFAWAEILTRYRLERELPDGLLLARTQNTGWDLQPLDDRTSQFGELVDVPAAPSGLLWMRFDLTPTLRGRATALVYKPTKLKLTVESEHALHSFVLLAKIGDPGFLLSPMIERPEDVVRLLAGMPRIPAPARQVTRVGIDVLSPADDSGYEPHVSLHFFQLKIPAGESSGSTAPRLLATPKREG